MSTDRHESKKQDSDPNIIQSSSPTHQIQHNNKQDSHPKTQSSNIQDHEPADQHPPNNAFFGMWATCKKFWRKKPKASTSPKPDVESKAIAKANTSYGLAKKIESSFESISSMAKDFGEPTETLILDKVHELDTFYHDSVKDLEDDEKEKKLEDLDLELIRLKLAIPSKKTDRAHKKDPLNDLNFPTIKPPNRSPGGVLDQMHPFRENHVFMASMELKEFVARFDKLEDRSKLCLLCFSIFPADAIIKKRLMVQWWVVEGYASSEEEADDRFKLLIDKGFVEPVNDNRSPSCGSCRIHPFHRLALVVLADKANFFNFAVGGRPTQNFSGCFQSCLMGAGLISYEDFKKRNEERNKEKKEEKKSEKPDGVIRGLINELEKVHLVMNVDEHILEFKYEWFGSMKNVNVLYLGRWKASGTEHIEVDDVEFLKKGLKSTIYVKLLSLQGVSNIISLPESILSLKNLKFLDLRACYNLETIPESIGNSLKWLTHLDMSECFLVTHMPTSLSELSQLKVLKGFFVDDEKKEKEEEKEKRKTKKKKGCTLGDLKRLLNLEKLCIYTNSKEFPEVEHVKQLGALEKLSKLTITWGVGEQDEEKSKNPSEEPKKKEVEGGQLPKSLTKLDLKCFRMEKTPYWLKVHNLKHTDLKKLYIRGGKLRDVGQYQAGDEKWKVEQLRLKYLDEIKIEWRRLRELFPSLKYLEQVSCPGLSFFPCDAKGVWINQE